MTKRIFVLAALLSAVCVTGAFAQVTVSGGLALSSVKEIEFEYAGGRDSPDIDADVGVGGNLFVDYLLPIGVPLSLGGEIGVDGASFEIDGYDDNTGDPKKWKETITAIPILLRVAYHFDLLPKLDLYIVGKIGYVIGIWEGDARDMFEKSNASIDDVGGIGFGFDIGAAYYFNSKIGAFIEVGFDEYALETEISYPGSYKDTFKTPFNRFLTVGVSGKF